MDAELEWQLNGLLSIGPWTVTVSPDVTHAQLRSTETHGFTTREHARAGRLSGSRLFEREDGWRVRYSCVLGTWSLELSPPAHGRFDSFATLYPDTSAPWHEALPAVIGDEPPAGTSRASDSG